MFDPQPLAQFWPLASEPQKTARSKRLCPSASPFCLRGRELVTWGGLGSLGFNEDVAVGQHQWYHFGVGAPPILEPILGMFTGGTGF